MSQPSPPYAKGLEALKERLLLMGGLVESRLRVVVQALVDRNRDALTDGIAVDSRIDDLKSDLDNRCFTLLALCQPVATDLRTVVSTLKINTDFESIGHLS